MKTRLQCGRFLLDLHQPRIMGIINLTDDSFSGDGFQGNIARAIDHGLRLVAEGADLLDLGGESSRPGATPVSQAQELDRLLPVIEGLRPCGVPISIDTVKPEVMSAALATGADMINDIAALETPGALSAVAASNAAICLMHMQGQPRSMQTAPHYQDVVQEVADYLAARAATCADAGIAQERIVLDPGFGFGKTLVHNLALLRGLDHFVTLGYPILVGLSRKSMLGQITGKAIPDRLPASLAAALLAVQQGARIVRVHDVAATRDVLSIWAALQEE